MLANCACACASVCAYNGNSIVVLRTTETTDDRMNVFLFFFCCFKHNFHSFPTRWPRSNRRTDGTTPHNNHVLQITIIITILFGTFVSRAHDMGRISVTYFQKRHCVCGSVCTHVIVCSRIRSSFLLIFVKTMHQNTTNGKLKRGIKYILFEY